MSTSATILAVGRFKPALAARMEYPGSWYADVQAGDFVATEFGADIMVTRDGTGEIAQLLGVDMNNPKTWAIDPNKIDWQALLKHETRAAGDVKGFVADLRAFLAGNFRLFFRLDA